MNSAQLDAYLARSQKERDAWDEYRERVYRETGQRLGCWGCGSQHIHVYGGRYYTACGCGLRQMCISCIVAHHCKERMEMNADLAKRADRESDGNGG